jgi:integrase
LAAAYRLHVERHYRKGGAPTSQVHVIGGAVRVVRELYGSTQAADFGPLKLAAVREAMIDCGWSRTTINCRVAKVRQMFKWGVAHEMVPPTTLEALKAVVGLEKGRSEAKEPAPVPPVAEADVNAVLAHVAKPLADMIRVQFLCACRPGEIVLLSPCDVDRSSDTWEFVPASHKTEHRDRGRWVHFGPRAQAILSPYLDNRPADAYCFSPAEAKAARLADRYAARKTPLSCGNRPGTNRVASRRRPPADRYTTTSYRRAVSRACKAAGLAGRERPSSPARSPPRRSCG